MIAPLPVQCHPVKKHNPGLHDLHTTDTACIAFVTNASGALGMVRLHLTVTD